MLKKTLWNFMSEIWWSGLQAFARSVQNIPNKSQWLEFSTPAPKDQLPTLILREKYNQGFGPPAITVTFKFYSFSTYPIPLFPQVVGTDDSAKHLGDEKSPRNSERQREHLRVDAGENFACFDLFWQNSIEWMTGCTRCTVHLAHFGQQPEIEICTQAIQPRLCFLNWD